MCPTSSLKLERFVATFSYCPDIKLIPSSPKKKVSFADDFGDSLVTIHCIAEDTESLALEPLTITYDPFPTKWLLKQVSTEKNKKPLMAIPLNPFIHRKQIGFQQPCNDYI